MLNSWTGLLEALAGSIHWLPGGRMCSRVTLMLVRFLWCCSERERRMDFNVGNVERLRAAKQQQQNTAGPAKRLRGYMQGPNHIKPMQSLESSPKVLACGRKPEQKTHTNWQRLQSPHKKFLAEANVLTCFANRRLQLQLCLFPSAAVPVLGHKYFNSPS